MSNRSNIGNVISRMVTMNHIMGFSRKDYECSGLHMYSGVISYKLTYGKYACVVSLDTKMYRWLVIYCAQAPSTQHRDRIGSSCLIPFDDTFSSRQMSDMIEHVFTDMMDKLAHIHPTQEKGVLA